MAEKLIGRYEVIEELGHGAMGSVFKARDPIVGRIVALKTIHSAALSGSDAETYRARFQREARASGALAHPGIVPVFDVGDHEGAPFLVMEFVAGRTLADAMKRGERFPLDRVCEIGQQIAEALGYAHRQGVIHRDIKPANILLTSREVYGCERPRITDFGIAKLAASEITVTGQMLGTPSFMPPEQFTGSPIDGRADLFSLGVILYAMTTGEQPFPGETMTAVSYKIVYTEPIPPSKLNPAIPARLEALILRCLAKSPADRYQTGEELAQDLAAIRAGAGSTVMGTAAPLPAAIAIDPDATLPPTSAMAAYSTAAKPPAAAKPQPGAAIVGKRTKIPIGIAASVAAIVLIAAAAGGWFLWSHMHQRSQTAQVQPKPLALPAPQPVVQPLGMAPSPAPVPIETKPLAPAPEPSPAPKPTPAKPAPGTPRTPASPAKPTQPPASATPPAVASTPPPAAAAPAPAPSSAATPGASAPAPAAANVPFNPRTLDAKTNAKLKIQFSNFPKGLPYTVEMNGKVYLRGAIGDSTNLDNLYVPPGMQEFLVQMMSGGREVSSNTAKDDFKAKKRKTLKIELKEQTAGASTPADPLGKGTQIVLSLHSDLLGDLNL